MLYRKSVPKYEKKRCELLLPAALGRVPKMQRTRDQMIANQYPVKARLARLEKPGIGSRGSGDRYRDLMPSYIQNTRWIYRNWRLRPLPYPFRLARFDSTSVRTRLSPGEQRLVVKRCDVAKVSQRGSLSLVGSHCASGRGFSEPLGFSVVGENKLSRSKCPQYYSSVRDQSLGF